MTSFIVSAMYKFAPLGNPALLQRDLSRICRENGICGTLLLAPEGINGTIAGKREGMDKTLAFLRGLPGFADLEHKESLSTEAPFHRLKIRIKKEIVTIGVPGVDPCSTVGEYVEPKDWNALIADPDVIVLDTRNDYEMKIGTFRNAVDPKLETFRAFPDFVDKNLHNQKHRKVAMFCTGGIRCEKASSLMKQMGFDRVYHLKGGILKYLENVPPEQSLWDGECFVFDQRISVGHGLAPGSYSLCPGCRWPVGDQDRQSPKFIEGVACPHCHDTLSPEKKAALAERWRQVRLAAARGEKHIGGQQDAGMEG